MIGTAISRSIPSQSPATSSARWACKDKAGSHHLDRTPKRRDPENSSATLLGLALASRAPDDPCPVDVGVIIDVLLRILAFPVIYQNEMFAGHGLDFCSVGLRKLLCGQTSRVEAGGAIIAAAKAAEVSATTAAAKLPNCT